MRTYIYLLSAVAFLYLSITPSLAQSDEEEVFKVVEQMPSFPGCADSDNARMCSREKIKAFVNENLEYPEVAKKKGITGKVVVRFIVYEDGSLKDAQVLREIGDGCGEAALALVEKMNALPQRWTPGKQRGRPVKVEFTLPVEFSLEEDSGAIGERSSPPPPPPPPPPAKGEEDIFISVEQMPMFPGCEGDEMSDKQKHSCSSEKMLMYIYKNLKYPLEARKNKTEGMVVTQFVVSEEGKIINIKIYRDIGDGCGEAALEVVEGMNDLPRRWVPGQQRGKPVKVLYTLPIKFKLDAKKTKKRGRK